MKTLRMAESYVIEARELLREANEALFRRLYHLAVRRSQETVEISFKAILRLFGIEYPKEHDVSKIFEGVKEYLPKWIIEPLSTVSKASAKLAKARGPAIYGDEEALIPPSELFKEKDAREALKDAKFAYNLAVKTLTRFKKK